MITTPAEMEASDRTEEPIEEIKRPDACPRPAPTTEARSVIGLQDLRQRIYATAKAGRVRMEKGGVAIGCTAHSVRYYRESLPSDRPHNPWRGSCRESLVLEIGPPGSLWRGMETRG